MSIGNRSYEKFDRAPQELCKMFEGLPIANIADCMGRICCVDQGIKPYSKNCHILGPAYTVKVPAGDNLLVHKALDSFKPGDVLVVDGNGCMNRSLVGEMMCTYAMKRGCAGIIIDGVIRDLAGVSKLDMPVYARGVQANGPYKNGPGEIGCPVAIGGIVIYPGDVIVSDEDGVLAVRPYEAEAVAKAARNVNQVESKILDGIRANGFWNRKVFADAVVSHDVELIDSEYRFK